MSSMVGTRGRYIASVLGTAVGLSACSPPSVEVTDPAATPACHAIAAVAIDDILRRTEELADVVPRWDPGTNAETAMTWLQGSSQRPLHGLAGRGFEARWQEQGCTDGDEFEALDEWLASFDRTAWHEQRSTAEERGDTRLPVRLLVPAQLMLRHSSLDPSRPRDPDRHAGEAVDERLPEDLAEVEPDADGVLFRLGLPDGEPQGLTLLADGTVVALMDGSVHAGRDAVIWWRVDDATMDEVIGFVLDPELLGDLEPPPPTGTGTGSGEVANMVYGGCCAVGLPLTVAHAAVDLLSDPERYLEPPQRYVPSTLSVQARRAEATDGAPSDLPPAQPWPLDRSIVALSEELSRDPTDGPVLQMCLHDDDAAAVWDLLRPGTNRTWLAVVEEDTTWYLQISLRVPGFRSAQDPCHPAGGSGRPP